MASIKQLIKAWEMLEKTLILYLPIAAFLVMFIVFVLEIFFRYVLNSPLTWAYEITVMMYIWMVILGSCYTTKVHNHVIFTMIYEKFSQKGRAIISALADFLIFILFLLSVKPTIPYIFSMDRQTTSALLIGLDVVYAPYLVFLFFTILYFFLDFCRDIRILAGKAGNEAVKEFDVQGMSDYEQEIQKANENAPPENSKGRDG